MTPERSIAERVDDCVKACLNGTPDGALVVEGIVRTFGFSPVAVEAHRGEIAALLDEMPPMFHKSGGGGWSFLNLCLDKRGEHWAGHQTMEALCCLGIAAGMAKWLRITLIADDGSECWSSDYVLMADRVAVARVGERFECNWHERQPAERPAASRSER